MSREDVRLAAEVMAMADARRFDSAAVLRALGSSTPYVRRMATLSIGQAGGRSMAGTLRSLVTDADTGVAANAAFALGLLKDTAAVSVLGRALRIAPPVALEAAWSLGEIGEPARAVILDALATPFSRVDGVPPYEAARVQLVHSASRLRPLPAAELARYAQPPEPMDPQGATAVPTFAVARAGAYAFSRPRSPAGVRRLLVLSRSLDTETRAHVARGLGLPAPGDSLADTAFATLLVLARDSAAHVRINAVRSLATYGARAREALLAAASDRDANVRITLAQSLVTVPLADRAEWTRLWSADTGFTFRSSLVGSALRAGVVLDALTAGGSDRWQLRPDWRYRAAAANAAGSASSSSQARELVGALTRDTDGRVRAAAFGALAAWVDSAGPERESLRRELATTALVDPDEQVRATAIASLAGSARAAEIAPVLASYRMALGDSGNDARLAAIRFFGSAWRNDSGSFGALADTLRALAAPGDPLERGAARGNALFSHWSGTAGTSRPLSWYEGVVRSAVAPSLGGNPPTADIVTERGTITIELFGADAPLTVTNFLSLARSGLYRDTRFHRVVPNFVAQDGDPRGDGSGGPGYAIRDELNRRRYVRGAVGMALSGPDTGGSQYFLTHSPQPHLDGHYTVFGRVVQGLDVLDRLVQGDRILEVRAR
ncbi:MAG TPA: peptidylprolyl isomerase [Gemmatimonadaceae bacterium]|nr:peptidylprolyl isomerase [Gemmatimonadaceae bacterium]